MSHYLQGFSTIPGGWPWDFFHQQQCLNHLYKLVIYFSLPGQAAAAAEAEEAEPGPPVIQCDGSEIWLPSRELTYPPKVAFWI